MFKLILKKIAIRLYQIGYFEKKRIDNEEKNNFYKNRCEIDSSAWIGDDASILNEYRPKNKLKIGARSRIMGQLFLFDSSGEINIGEDCFIGLHTRVWSSKKIVIGNRVLIAHNVNIHDNISHPLNAQERYDENSNFVLTNKHNISRIKSMEIVIEDDVWIGFNSIILRGVTIGKGAIIGAGSVVTKDVEPWTVNVGNPSKCIRKQDPVIVTKKNIR